MVVGYCREIFVTSPSNHFECPICHQIVRDPVHCTDEHHFCRTCLYKWMTNNKICPCDRKPLEQDSIIPSRFLNNIINDLIVRCPTTLKSDADPVNANIPSSKISNDENCSWTGPIRTISTHTSACEYVYIACPLEGCSIKTTKKGMSDHIISCEYRIINCVWCKSAMPYNKLSIHETICEDRPVTCPNGCSTSIPFKDVDSHRTVCVMEAVRCPLYESLGCEIKCLRGDIQAHLEDNSAHTQVMISSLLKLQEKVKVLEQENISLKLGYGQFISFMKGKLDSSERLVGINHSTNPYAASEGNQSDNPGGCKQA